MEIREQIEVLKEAKKRVRSGRSGICEAIEDVLHLHKVVAHLSDYISCIMPVFAYKNACLFDKNVIYRSKNGYWWDIRNKESRCKFIDWMISELEKQLKDEGNENI